MSDQAKKSKMSKIIVIFLYAIAILFFLYAASLFLFKKKLVVVYSHSLNGNLDGCNCPSQPKGGAVKRSFFLEEFRKKTSDFLLIDGGDFAKPIRDDIITKYLVKAHDRMKYDVIAIGDQELVNGPDHILPFFEEYPFFVSSNLTIAGKKAHEYIIKDVKNVKVGVFSLISKDTLKFIRNDIKKDLRVDDPVEKAREIVKKLKDEKVDVIILLSHLGVDLDKDLIENIDGIDLLLNGHDELFYDKRKLKKQKDTYLMTAGDNGYRLGIMELSLRNKKIVGLSNELIPIKSTDYEDDTVIRGWINDYKKEWEDRRKKLMESNNE